MREHDRALAVCRAIVPAGARDPDPPVGEEERLRRTVEEISALDAEIEALSDALADFSRRWERAVGAAFEDLSAAERLVRRLQALEGGLATLAGHLREGESPETAPRRPRRARSRTDAGAAAPEAGTGDGDPGAEDAPLDEVLPEAQRVKRLYRRLARVLHPDFARDEGERRRLGDVMARVNAAYEKGDLTALELIAEKVGAGEPPGELGPAERRAHLERRTATLARIVASLARERDRLARSDTQRLRDEADRRAAQGRDFLAESRAEVVEEAAETFADARARLARVDRAAREVSRARSHAMKQLERRGPTGARRAFDPLGETELVRLGASRLARQRATPAARELARTLEAEVTAAPWHVALTLLAFFAEDSGGRPPDALAGSEGWSLRWDRLREAWPDAPDLSRAAARLPRWLALGARTQGGEVVAGVQLCEAALLAGVRIALERESVACVARAVLAALGPDVACDGCGGCSPALHLLRTRGLDELHGLACPACGRILRSYWRYGAVDGMEALAPHALRLGLVAEATAQVAGTTLGFQMLPCERDALTADGLCRRFAEIYLAPYDVDLPPSALRVVAGKRELAGGARLPPGEGVRLAIARGAGTTADELVELLRARIERRFRP